VQYKQQANPLLSMNNYTPLVISWNDKNAANIVNQRKLAITAILRFKIIGAPNKFKK
jgi:hypothetical protein